MLERLANTGAGFAGILQLLQASGQDLLVGFRAYGKPHLIVTNEKSLIVVMKANSLVFEHPAIGISENREQNARAPQRVGIPVDIKIRCKFGLLPVLE